MDELKVFIPYADVMRLKEASDELDSVKSILNTEFPDDTCQLIAIKAVLGIVDEIEESTDSVDPIDPGTDPTDPPTP